MLVVEAETLARAELALEGAAAVRAHRDAAVEDLAVQAILAERAVGIPAILLAHQHAEIRAADADGGDWRAQPVVGAVAVADRAGERSDAAVQQAEESSLSAALARFVDVLVDDEIGARPKRDDAPVGETDLQVAARAGMDLVARLDACSGDQPHDLAGAQGECVADRGQHLPGGFRARGRGGAEDHAKNREQPRGAHGPISIFRSTAIRSRSSPNSLVENR